MAKLSEGEHRNLTEGSHPANNERTRQKGPGPAGKKSGVNNIKTMQPPDAPSGSKMGVNSVNQETQPGLKGPQGKTSQINVESQVTQPSTAPGGSRGGPFKGGVNGPNQQTHPPGTNMGSRAGANMERSRQRVSDKAKSRKEPEFFNLF